MVYWFRISALVFLLPLAAMAGKALPPAAGIASAHPLATQAGHEILKKGGNAFDAAVAVTAALAVVEPMGSGLGGGGFWLLHRAEDGFEVMIDGRERAPLAATENMYLNQTGDPIHRASLNGPRAAAIPGEPAALAYIAKHYGRLPLKVSLAPAIRYANSGFRVTPRYQRLAKMRRDVLINWPETAKVFLQQGEAPQVGALIRQPDLAYTLKRIARRGHKGFYYGTIARRLVKGVRRAGGIWTRKDLEAYQVVERQPVRGEYRGMRVTSAALPSSGGIVLMEMLNILSGFDLDDLSGWQRKHLVIEAMRLAYRDRARYLGDADFIDVDVARLISREYADRLRRSIKTHRASVSEELPETPVSGKGRDTTHFSIIDHEGNRVAATLSINYPFGSGFMAPGTGVVLNNEMDDFAIKPGVPNVYGLVGNKANAIAPGKRPLSSMTPTFLETSDAVVILGTPGGSRIITMVLLAALEFAHGRGGVEQWVTLPRYHHQYLPDVVVYEVGAFNYAEKYRLEDLGHQLQPRKSSYGNMQLVLWDKRNRRVEAASDPRGEGRARVR